MLSVTPLSILSYLLAACYTTVSTVLSISFVLLYLSTGAAAQSSGFGSKAGENMASFGSLAGSSETATFGSIAGAAQPASTPFGQPQPNTFGSPGFGNTSGFGQQSSPFGGAASPPG